MDMSQRTLQLLSLLQNRREWSGAELAQRLGVTERTIRRDVERLRHLDYPVKGTTGTVGGYRLEAGPNLPPLALDDDEAVAVAAALHHALRRSASDAHSALPRALAKLDQILPRRLRRQLETLSRVTSIAAATSESMVDPDVLSRLAIACRDAAITSFNYRDRDGTPGQRHVEPHHLVTAVGLWYLIAYDRDRADWRIFRVDRAAAPDTSHRRFAPRELPDSDPARFVARRLAATPYRHHTTARVNASAEDVTRRAWPLIPERVTPIDAGSCHVELSSDDPAEIVRQLISIDADFTVEGSEGVLTALRTASRRLSKAFETPP